MEQRWKQSRCHVLNSGVWGASEALTPYLVRLTLPCMWSNDPILVVPIGSLLAPFVSFLFFSLGRRASKAYVASSLILAIVLYDVLLGCNQVKFNISYRPVLFLAWR
jgi:hypothetical protein